MQGRNRDKKAGPSPAVPAQRWPSWSAEPLHGAFLTSAFPSTFSIFLRWETARRGWNFLLPLGPDPRSVPGTGMTLARIRPPPKEQRRDFSVCFLLFFFFFFLKQMFISLVVLATRALLYRARRSLADPGGRGRAQRAGIARGIGWRLLGQGLSWCRGP